MKLRTSTTLHRKSGVASIVLAMALVSGTLAFSAPPRSDGGTPIGDQGKEAQRQNEIMKHTPGAQPPQSSAPQSQYNRGSRGDYHGNYQSRNNNDHRHYDNNRYYSRNYHSTPRYTPHYTPRYDYGYYGYAEPYAYAPYDAYPSPGLSLFFNF